MKITKSDYYKIVGLLTLSRSHTLAIEDILKALCEITKEEDEFGHCSDFVWGVENPRVDDLLRKLGIEIEDE